MMIIDKHKLVLNTLYHNSTKWAIFRATSFLVDQKDACLTPPWHHAIVMALDAVKTQSAPSRNTPPTTNALARRDTLGLRPSVSSNAMMERGKSRSFWLSSNTVRGLSLYWKWKLLVCKNQFFIDYEPVENNIVTNLKVAQNSQVDVNVSLDSMLKVMLQFFR